MFKKKTVFVLGAGASHSYSYPTGGELTKWVWQEILETNISFRNLIANSKMAHLRDCFERMATDLRDSSVVTIDEWLARNTSYIEVGKICIARQIIGKEANNVRWIEDDLPPKKWTQRRVGFSMTTGSKFGGVQWMKQTEKSDDLTGILRSQRSRWSQKVAINPQRWQEAWGLIPTSSTAGSISSAATVKRLFPARVT